MAPEWPSSGGGGPGSVTAREWRRLDLSPFCKNSPDTDTKTGRCQDLEEDSGRARQGHIDTVVPSMGEPPRG